MLIVEAATKLVSEMLAVYVEALASALQSETASKVQAVRASHTCTFGAWPASSSTRKIFRGN